MDLTNILNTKEGAAAAAASASPSMTVPQELSRGANLASVQEQNSLSPHSEVPSEADGSQHLSGSPSASDQSSVPFNGRPPAQLPSPTVSVAYSSALQQQQQQQLQHQHQQLQQVQHQQLQHHHQQQQQQQLQQVHQQQMHQQQARGPGRPPSGDPSAKAFPCSSCGKGFARRSDLARHGMSIIHV
jgi:hypothetical protein